MRKAEKISKKIKDKRDEAMVSPRFVEKSPPISPSPSPPLISFEVYAFTLVNFRRNGNPPLSLTNSLFAREEKMMIKREKPRLAIY